MGGAATGRVAGRGAGTGETLDSVAAAKKPRGGSRNPRRDEFLAPGVGVSPAARSFLRREWAYPPPRRAREPLPQRVREGFSFG